MGHINLENQVQTTCKASGCDRPVYVENNSRKHPYCGIVCARSFDASFSNGRQGRDKSTFQRALCKIWECDKPCYIEPSGIRHPYCSRTCARKDFQNPNTNTKKDTRKYTGFEKELIWDYS
ncbi:hypothetical protein F8M41_018795 [Gigaspora margarita]|uniref:Uncharacterized protein n=1 Tax=Gigaspora margarita TaxID=4874 RepID=A0A8H4EKX5_GIGMA|nr:hypothetical protein F8M41_018795 [Gigaspora margarita]